MHTPLHYRIRIAGHLSPNWSDWFAGFSVQPHPNGETVITGPVRDQAELNGLLNRLFSLNLVVLDVRSDISPPDEDPDSLILMD
jgi:hypothetical protein